jgi:pentatricopeptide repeat protein
VKCGQEREALELFQQMQQEGLQPDSVTFVAVLNACALVGALKEGRRAHEHIIECGCELNKFVGSSLIDMYAKCGSLDDAMRVFNNIPLHDDVISWNALISGYVKGGQGQKALELFQQMLCQGVEPDAIAFVGALNACANVGALGDGRHVHKQIIESGFEDNVFVGCSLIDMYAKCGSIEDAWSVFNSMPLRDAVAWSAMILGHAKCGQGQKALQLFEQMQQEGVEPDYVTFMGVLNACASLGALEQGRRVH